MPGDGFGPGVVSPHHGRGMDRSSWGFDVRWAKTTYLRAQVGARGKLFSVATVQATTACGVIQVIVQLSTPKGSRTSHSCGEPPDEPPLPWTQIGSPEKSPSSIRRQTKTWGTPELKPSERFPSDGRLSLIHNWQKKKPAESRSCGQPKSTSLSDRAPSSSSGWKSRGPRPQR